MNRPTDKASLEGVAVRSLEPSSLLKAYDLEGKGFLSEDEALLMVADLYEAHSPDDTSQLNAMMAQMLDRVRRITRRAGPCTPGVHVLRRSTQQAEAVLVAY